MGTVHQELNEAVFVEYIGRKWNKEKHISLDFSPAVFALTSLDSSPEGGLLNKSLNLDKLVNLNLSHNDLSDDINTVLTYSHGFSSLKTLDVSFNRISSPFLQLINLTELRLSHNALRTVPCLCGLKNLEVLSLSHNMIDQWIPEGLTESWGGGGMQLLGEDAYVATVYEEFQKCPNLRELDLSYNSLSWYPSQFLYFIAALRTLRQLEILGLQGNMFCEWFPEYTVYAFRGLGALHKLDDYLVTSDMRAAGAKLAAETPVERYDEVFHERIQRSELVVSYRTAQKREYETGVISVLKLTKLLQLCLSSPERAVELASQFYEHCSAAWHATEDSLKSLWDNVGSANEAKQQAITEMLQTASMVKERDERTRSLVLRGVGSLCAVSAFDLGKAALLCLGETMKSGSVGCEEVAHVIAETAVPAIQSKPIDDPVCGTIIRGLAALSPTKHLALCLKSAVPQLADFLEEDSMNGQILRVLSTCCTVEENCIEATGQGVPQVVSKVLLEVELPEEGEAVEVYVHLLRLVGDLSRRVRKAANVYTKYQIHVKVLLYYIRRIMGEREETLRLTVVQSKLLGELMNSLIGMMENNSTAMRDSCVSYYAADLFLVAAKEDISNPVVLPPSLYGLVLIMGCAELQESDYIRYVTDQVQKGAALLHYLGGRKYKRLAEQAEYHLMGTDSLPYRPEPPALQTLTNEYIHKVFAAVCHFLSFYLMNTQEPLCMAVNEHLAKCDREEILFSLLSVPSDDVKFEVLECICRVPLTFFEHLHLKYLLDLLSRCTYTFSGRTNEIVERLFDLLGRIAEDGNKSAIGSAMRSEFSTRAVEEVYAALCRTANVRTFHHRTQEEWKTRLSLSGVRCLQVMSRIQEFRTDLRSKTVTVNLLSMCKLEEDLHRPDNEDIVIERTWTGRDVGVLLGALSGGQRVSVDKKVGFRIVSRLADVLEGRPDSLDFQKSIVLRDLCGREQQMWDDKAARSQSLYLDEGEACDREYQHAVFVNLAGGERLAVFMTKLSSKTFEQTLAAERQKKQDSDYWAGKFKGDIKTMENKIESGEVDVEDLIKDVTVSVDIDSETSGRDLLMRQLQESSKELDEATSEMYLRSAVEMYGAGEVWRNLSQGVMNGCFMIAALYRSLYACMVFAVNDDTQKEMTTVLRRPSFVRKLVALLESCSLLDCNVGSKFCRLMKRAIQFEPHQPAESMDMIITYDIISRVLQAMASPLLHILRQAVSRPLDQPEQALCTDMAGLVSVMCRQTAYVKFSEDLDVQRYSVSRALSRFVSVRAMRAFVAMVIYDLQLDAGSAQGTYVSHLFEGTASMKENMRLECLAILSELIQWCQAKMKYECLEQFSMARVFAKYSIRNSLMFELLDQSKTGRYKASLEVILSEYSQRAERILKLSIVRHWTMQKAEEPAERVIAVTNFGFYILSKPKGIRNPDRPGEVYEHLPPRVEAVRDFEDMTRICRGYPGLQFFAVGWMEQGQLGSPYEWWDIIICSKLEHREPLMMCTYALSGPTSDSRVEILKDVVMRECLRDRVRFRDRVVLSTRIVLVHAVCHSDEAQRHSRGVIC
eukprot:GHVQ01001281.1.p1 GENE.GHVQ01001281.1~~GHVQ01001281.1.p1  ORF type:complete len:1562 (+),score=205.48 GHVQ01001281.1:31-4716(+)